MALNAKAKTVIGALLAIVLLGAAGLLYWQQSRLQSTIASNRLDTARAVQALVEQQIVSDLDTRAQLIAGNQAFVGYVSQAMGGILPGTLADNASIVDLLDERRAQLGLTLAAVIDNNGQLIASRDGVSVRKDFTREPLFVEAVNTIATTRGMWMDDSRVFYVSILPLAGYGSDAGFLLVGTPMDETRVRAIADAANVDVALVSMTAAGPSIAASTLGQKQASALLAALPKDATANADKEFNVRLGSERYRGYVAPLSGSSTLKLVVLANTNVDMASAAASGMPVIVGTLLALALLAGVAWFARAAMSRQVAEMARIVQRAASASDYHLQVKEAGLLAPLGAAFNQLLARLRDGN